MEIRHGLARATRYATDVQGTYGKDGGSVSTSQIAIFQLEGQPVRLQLDSPPIVNDGDEMVVAGEEKDGVFTGFAYHNRTQHAGESLAVGTNLLFGGVFIAIGCALVVASILEHEVGLALGGLVFGAFGASQLRHFLRVSQAARLIKEAAESASSRRMVG